jgi:dolichol-phosphate mannosyltransferase
MASLLVSTAAAYGLWSHQQRSLDKSSTSGQTKRYAFSVLLALFMRGGILAWLDRIPGCPDLLKMVGVVIVAYLIIYAFMTVFLDPRAKDLSSDPRSWPRLTTALLIYAVALRMVYLGLPELLHEEAYYWNYSMHLDIGYLDHPPMVAWIIWTFTRFMGHTELAVRLGAFCMWFIGAYYVFQLTRKMFDTPTAVGAVLLIAVLPIYFGFGLVMTPDAPLMACWAGALYFFYRVFIEKAPSAWLGVGLCIGLGMLSKYTIALLGPGALAFLLIDSKARQWFRHPAPYLAVLLAILLFLPVIVWNAQNGWASFIFQGPHRFSASFEFSLHELILSILVLLTPVGLMAVIAAVLSRKELVADGTEASDTERIRSYRLFMFLTFIPLSVFVFFSLSRGIKLNWTGPLWLGMVPYMARLMVKHLPAGAGRLRTWAHLPLQSTSFILLLIYSAGLYHLVLGLVGLEYPKNTLGLGWPDLAARIQKVVDNVEMETGQQPLVVGMDTDRINSWLAFYRSRAMAGSSGKNTGAGALDTAGRHLFGRRSHMYRFWFPPNEQFHKPMVLVGYKTEHVQDDRIKAYIERAKPIEEILVFKNGRVTGRYYYRIIYGYHALRKDKT